MIQVIDSGFSGALLVFGAAKWTSQGLRICSHLVINWHLKIEWNNRKNPWDSVERCLASVKFYIQLSENSLKNISFQNSSHSKQFLWIQKLISWKMWSLAINLHLLYTLKLFPLNILHLNQRVLFSSLNSQFYLLKLTNSPPIWYFEYSDFHFKREDCSCFLCRTFLHQEYLFLGAEPGCMWRVARDSSKTHSSSPQPNSQYSGCPGSPIP